MTVRDAVRLDLQAQPASVSEARRFVRRVLTEWDLPEVIDTVALLTSELATNAVLHARTPYAVLVQRDNGDVRVDVLDGSEVAPWRRKNTQLAATGRGVAMVERLSTAWGNTPAKDLQGFAKGVWFAVPASGVGESTWDGRDWPDGL